MSVITSAELIVRARRQLTLIEELAAKGMSGRRVLMEVACLCGMVFRLRCVAEDEHKQAILTEESRNRAHRDQVAEAL